MGSLHINRSTWPMLLILLLLLAACTLPAAANGVAVIARGDPYTLTGTAAGAPDAGVAVWVFGENYWRRETVSVADDRFSFEIGGGETEDLSPGMYTVVVQHPMGNGWFDVGLAPATPQPEQTSVVSTGGGRFVIEGPGALPSPQAAGALVTLLNDPAIDDTYFSTAFVLENPWVLPDEPDGGVFRAGDDVTLSGTTNLAAGNELVWTIESLQLNATPEGGNVAASTASGSTVVQPGTPRTFSLTFPSEGWPPGYYLITLENPDTGYAFQAGFLLVEEVAEEQTAIAVEETPMATGAEASPEPTQAGLGPVAVLSICVILGARVRRP
jgi:hypothetical protein